ncbi:MAG: hypothetical protein R3A78_09460 [Polyangiales bacterium]
MGDVVRAAWVCLSDEADRRWSGLGVEPVWYDGRRELWSQRGSTSDVLLSIQHPQGRRNVLNVWVAPSVFATLAPRPLDATKLHLWEAAGWGLEHGDVASLLEERSKRPPVRCEWDAFRAAIQRYVESRNWHALATARRLGCEAALVEDQATQVVYVVARPDAHARAARIDARGVDRVVEDVSSARIAVLGGAQTIVWEAAP